MPEAERNIISRIRLERAEECLEDSRENIDSGRYKNAANRSYYAVFHSMRAVLALDGFDSKKHSGVISKFRNLYIKSGTFDTELSKIITKLFEIRGKAIMMIFTLSQKMK